MNGMDKHTQGTARSLAVLFFYESRQMGQAVIKWKETVRKINYLGGTIC